jgi:hypothetical protein
MTTHIDRTKIWRESLRILAICATFLLAPITVLASASDSYYMLVFSGPVHDNQDVEYNRWYNKQHAPDVVAVPGFVSAQRFVVNDVQLGTGAKTAPLPKYLVLFKIVTDDLKRVMTEVDRRIQTGKTVISPTLDRQNASAYIYRALGPQIAHASKQPTQQTDEVRRYIHFVLTVPVDGKESEFNEWYDKHHGPEMAALPGVVSAQRLIFQQGEPPKVPPTKYAALFEIETVDIRITLKAMRDNGEARSSNVPIDPQQTKGYTYRAIGPIIYGDDIRRARALVGTAE